MIVVLHLFPQLYRPDMGLIVVTNPPEVGGVTFFCNGHEWPISYDPWLGEITLHGKLPQACSIQIYDFNGCSLDNYIVRTTPP